MGWENKHRPEYSEEVRLKHHNLRGLIGRQGSMIARQRELYAEVEELKRKINFQEDVLRLNSETRDRQADLIKVLERQALTDPLTQLPNKGAFMHELENAAGLSNRHRHALSLMMCDIDGLKSVNDSFGHPTGDILISSAANIMRSNVRNYEKIFRLGGDEFALLLYLTAPDQAEHLAERLRTAIEHQLLNMVRSITRKNRILFNRNAPFTMSIGISGVLPPHNHILTPEALIDEADTALYHSKRDAITGERINNRITVYKPGMVMPQSQQK